MGLSKAAEMDDVQYCLNYAEVSAYFLGWLWVDPLASMILSVLVLKSGIGTFRLALKNI